MTRKMQLTEALKLKERVEESIEDLYGSLYTAKDTTEYRNHTLVIKELNEQLSLLKDAIQKKNLKSRFGKESNSSRIYRLSNLAKDKKFFETLCTGRKPKTSIVMTKENAEARIKMINHDMSEIQEELTEFNKKNKVRFEVKPIIFTLGLLK